MGPLRFPDKPEAKEISWKLWHWQASGVTANVCYLALCNPYGKDLEDLVAEVACIFQRDEEQSLLRLDRGDR